MEMEKDSPRADHGVHCPRAWYAALNSAFVGRDAASIIGELAIHSGFSIDETQRDAWLTEIEILQRSLVGIDGGVLFEFSIPRMGRRADAIVIAGSAIFVIEFKVGSSRFDRAAVEQVWDYALDLKNFHEGSHHAPIVPLLVATEAPAGSDIRIDLAPDGVARPLSITSATLRDAIIAGLQSFSGADIDVCAWAKAAYRPTPTIVEAARSLYANHSVEQIARSDAGAQNLHITSQRLEDLADEARRDRRKLICFVTGVPGAGKTLVGLNIATRRSEESEETHAVFLSGNGPLVAVLREALTRDEWDRRKTTGEKIRKGEIRNRVETFIQNVHHFRDSALIESGPPPEHVVIFDEAQRAWNLQQTASFMQRKKKRPGFNYSEPEFLISYMDRHEDWAVIICLVGGGQEINTGEAGIGEWLEAVDRRFPHWDVVISSRLVDSEYRTSRVFEDSRVTSRLQFEDLLHLSVSMRSFRAEHVSSFVKAVLDGKGDQARELFKTFADRYPLKITRDLAIAKDWIRERSRGSERYGLVASSRAQRLKPHAIDIRVPIDPVHWFLNDRSDTRSSFYLEDAATEFQVQGLELDWACVTWDGDFRLTHTGWSFHDFRGDRWQNVNQERRAYILNAYRVLLTRARQGMVVFIPPGNSGDRTRLPEFYDATFRYLEEIGIPVL